MGGTLANLDMSLEYICQGIQLDKDVWEELLIGMFTGNVYAGKDYIKGY